MANFKLSNKAVEDLTTIWEYTLGTWSEEQADNYYHSLISCCREIANNPDIGAKYYTIAPNLRGIKANRHIIFYHENQEGNVEVIRILHERMDLKNRLSE